MARVTVEDCLVHDENRFALVRLASKRARQILKGAPPKVKTKNRYSVTALKEIAAGEVKYNRPITEMVLEFVKQQHALEESRRD